MINSSLLILETVFKFTKTDAYFKESKVFDTQSTENDKIILCFTLLTFHISGCIIELYLK